MAGIWVEMVVPVTFLNTVGFMSDPYTNNGLNPGSAKFNAMMMKKRQQMLIKKFNIKQRVQTQMIQFLCFDWGIGNNQE
jgi:hypothetical protein